MKVWVIQTWSNYQLNVGKGSYHEVDYVHTASTKEAALDYCQGSPDYCGNIDNWHWCLSEVEVDHSYIDSTTLITPPTWHYERHGFVQCNLTGTIEDYEEELREDKLNIQIIELETLIENHAEDMKQVVNDFIDDIRGQFNKNESLTWLNEEHILER